MNEIWNSLSEWFKEKTASPFYGTFIISAIIWNWKFFYTLFIQDQDSLSLPKIEYVQKNLLSDNHWLIYVYFFILPLISTFVIIGLIPYLSNWAHKVSTSFYFKRKVIFDNATVEYEEKKNTSLKKIAQIKQNQSYSEKKIIKSMTDEDRWNIDFMNFSSQRLFIKFRQILKSIYKHGGFLYIDNAMLVDMDSLAFADSIGLIRFSDAHRNQIELTEKGKFFAAKYLEKNVL